MSLNNKFAGTGGMKKFVDACMTLFSALNNATVEMPSGYTGEAPTVIISGGSNPSLVIDFKNAAVFSPSNVDWIIYDTTAGSFVTPESKFTAFGVRVKHGRLILDIEMP